MANLVILTGAGISAESGISTFRDANGLWERHRIEDVASPQAFQRDPEMVHRFYNLRRAQLKSVLPNAAHIALARLEREWRGGFLLITQNVDDLHERAGSESLLHMHGELRKLRCARCEAVVYHEEDASLDISCQTCRTTGNLRPDIVWFGEVPYHLDRIYTAIAQADIFVAIGTSGQVYPAAAFAAMANQNGGDCLTIEVNPQPTGVASFHRVIAEPATIGVTALVRDLLASGTVL
ncbi:MAG: NAD-dependent protein deacylase [Acidocella sp. 20-57-95]|nr:MAG: NAD-dependent protein deacylase [Acidocella sp. 20-57-95]OYV57826.1 MAG: NAD-dependent protein deacylase [Acidocella sp. 21-58-7]HQT65469.1 NAD-dependent deacylase [Acidocella sp.]HQU05067.1 NAD-dependent deacylase [Acidocella sp.]